MGPEHVEAAQRLALPLTRLKEVSFFDTLLNYAPVKALLPMPILAALAPVIWWFFRDTWRELDREALQHRSELAARGETDFRPAACLVIVAIVLTLQEYYGGRYFYDSLIRAWLAGLEARGHHSINLARYDEYYSYVWWVTARVIGYVLIPFPVYKLIFRGDSLLDMGLRVRGFLSHVWI